jgi:hypothetical protein
VSEAAEGTFVSTDVTGSSPAATTPAPSSSASPATPSSAPSSPTPASASSTPAPASEPSVAPGTESSVPYARFKEVNDQLRTAREYQSKYGWAQDFERDSYSFVDSWIDQLAAHPEHQSKIFAKAARLLNSRRGQQPQTVEEPQPDVPIQDAQGNVVNQTYSSKQLKAWQEWNWQQREAALSERLGPLEKMKTQIEQAQEQAAVQQQSQQFASTALTKLRQKSWFKEHEPAIKTFFAEHEEYGDNLDAAALDYFDAHVLPTYQTKAETKVLGDLKTQAQGATVNPSGAASTAPPKFKNFSDAMKYYADHPDEAERMATR